MARPKTITLKDGVVHLLNFPKEISTKLALYIAAFDTQGETATPLPPQQPVAAAPQTFPVSDEMNEKALGYFLNDNTKQYSMVVVGYNPLTNNAAVESLEDVGEFRRDAVIAFKKVATQFNLV